MIALHNIYIYVHISSDNMTQTRFLCVVLYVLIGSAPNFGSLFFPQTS